MQPNKEQLLEKYSESENFNIPCFLEGNPKLTKLLTGQGASVAKKMYPNHISFDAELKQEDKYKVFKLAAEINKNPDVIFFTCVAKGNMTDIHIDFWGTDELMTAANLLDGASDALFGVLLNTNR